jgi:hypothetical protein
MAVDPGLVAVAPNEAKRIVADRLDAVQLQVAAPDEDDWPLVPLAVRTWAIPAEKLVRVYAPVPIIPIDFHDAGATRRTKLDGRRVGVAHETRPSQRPDAAPVRSRTATVAWCPSS